MSSTPDRSKGVTDDRVREGAAPSDELEGSMSGSFETTDEVMTVAYRDVRVARKRLARLQAEASSSYRGMLRVRAQLDEAYEDVQRALAVFGASVLDVLKEDGRVSLVARSRAHTPVTGAQVMPDVQDERSANSDPTDTAETVRPARFETRVMPPRPSTDEVARATTRQAAAELTEEKLAALRERMTTGRFQSDDAKSLGALARNVQSLHSRLSDAPEAVDNYGDAVRELRLLEELTGHDALRAAEELPVEVAHPLARHLAARARLLQACVMARSLLPRPDVGRLEDIFPRLGQYATDRLQQFVYGLARHHEPDGSTWYANVQYAWREFEDAVDPYLGAPDEAAEPEANFDDELRRLTERVHGEDIEDDELATWVGRLLEEGLRADERRLVHLVLDREEAFDGDGFGALRRAIEAAREEERAEEDDATAGPDDDWPYWRFVEGKRAAIVGGDSRPERAARIARAFRLDTLEWVSDSQSDTRRVQSLVERMANGTIDIVIVLRAFSSHRASNMIFREKPCDALRVLSDSYGITAIQLAFEHNLQSEI